MARLPWGSMKHQGFEVEALRYTAAGDRLQVQAGPCTQASKCALNPILHPTPGTQRPEVVAWGWGPHESRGFQAVWPPPTPTPS